jgi:ElaA protein
VSAYPVSTALHREWAADLTPERLYALLRLRVDVFVIEQKCPYQELDGRDLEPSTRHFWIASGTDQQVPLAYLRLLEDRAGVFRIGRVCTARDARGTGLSRRLMQAALAEIGDTQAVLEAQVDVADLYATFGFRPDGDPYDEDGILHVTMRRGT